MNENEKLALFYKECMEKGYSDMSDPKQALKAKVIATDRELQYGNSIEQLYQRAKTVYEEREAERIAEEQRLAEEARRCAVPGEELVKLHSIYAVISVFKRPDGSIYCTTNKAPKTKIEGRPEVHFESSSVTMYTYHPAETNITMASKGGFTSGQVWQTEPTVTPHSVNNGKAYLEVSINGESWEISKITVSSLVMESFKRYPCREDFLKQGLAVGEIKCHKDTSTAALDSAFVKAALQRDSFKAGSYASMAADEKRLPSYEVAVIADLLHRILDGPWPENDEQAYEHGKKLIVSDKSSEILEGINLLKEIDEKHPRKKSAEKLIEEHKERYEEVLQAEKEAAVLKREEKERKQKKVVSIAASIVCVCIAIAILLTQVIIPKQKYNNAMSLINAGEYDSAYAILEEIGNTEAIAENKYDRAMDAIDAGDYDFAYTLLEEIGNDEAIEANKYDRAMELIGARDYEAAYALLEEIGDTETIQSSKYDRAMEQISAGDYDSAYALLKEIGNKEAIAANKYDRAMERIDAKDYEAALELLDGVEYKDSETQRIYAARQYYKPALESAAVGDTIVFGSYEQDNDTSNGAEDIEWLVLAKKGNRLLVISRYALDSKNYSREERYITWENCTLRQWLNDDFLNTAFLDGEKGMIPAVTVPVDKNPKYNTDPGRATRDKIFLLSITEVNRYFTDDEARMCVPTAYAEANGIYTDRGYTIDDAAACWWYLRSPGMRQDAAAGVDYDGSVNTGGYFAYPVSYSSKDGGVRPAMWIDLSN